MPLSSPSHKLLLLSIKELSTVLFFNPFSKSICCKTLPSLLHIIIPPNTEFRTIRSLFIVIPPRELLFLINWFASVFHGWIFPFSYINKPASSVVIIIFFSRENTPHISEELNISVPSNRVNEPLLYSKSPFVVSWK